MNCLKLEVDRRIKGNKIEDIRNNFWLKKEIDENVIKDIRNLLRLRKLSNQRQNYIRYLFKLEDEEENHYKPIRIGNFYNNI